MASSGQEARFPIVIQADPGPSDALANSLDHLRQRIQGGESALKEMSGSLRRLKGSTDEVKAAKNELKTKIEAERNAISASSLAIVKAGTSYDALSTKSKKLADRVKSDGLEKAKERAAHLAAAVKQAGGPLQGMKDALDRIREVAGGAGGGLAVATLAIAGMVTAIVALSAAAISGAIALGRWIFETANAARTANLFREAATGTATSAKNLGDQIDALSDGVSTSKAKLNEMALSLAKLRISGQAQVDTLNAIAQAGDAMGDDVANTLKGLVSRSQMTQRMFVSPQELWGTGIEFKDVAGELAKQLNVGVRDAQQALLEGRVKLDDGAKALRTAVEKRFGEINARKMLDLNVQSEKFHETLGALTKGVTLEPLLRAVDSFRKEFDETSVTGHALKTLVEAIGNGMVKAVTGGAPAAKAFLQGAVIGALKVGTAFLKVEHAIERAFGGKNRKDIDGVNLAFQGTKLAVEGVGLGLAASAAAIGSIALAAKVITQPFVDLKNAVTEANDFISTVDWNATGASIVDGIVSGVNAGVARLRAAVKGLGKSAITAMKEALDSHSPSKAFEKIGKGSPEGYAQGVERAASTASDAVSDMGKGALGAAPSGGGGRRGGSPISVTVEINVSGGGGGQETAKQLSSPSFLGGLTKAIEDALVGAGIPVQTDG